MQSYLIAQQVLIELIITGTPAAGLKQQFVDVPELNRQYVKVYGIMVHSLNQDYATSTAGNPILGTTELQQVLFTVSNRQGTYTIRQEPAISFVPGNNGGLIRWIRPTEIDIQKSYIELTGNTSIVANDTFAVSMIYDYYNQ